MSDIYVVEVESENNNTIDIESGSVAGITHITLEVVNTEIIQINDLPDNIPISKISGLNTYLNNYQFDCGSP